MDASKYGEKIMCFETMNYWATNITYATKILNFITSFIIWIITLTQHLLILNELIQFKCLVVVYLPNVKSSLSFSLLLLTFVKAFSLEILKSIYIDSDPTFQAESNFDRLSVSLARNSYYLALSKCGM